MNNEFYGMKNKSLNLDILQVSSNHDDWVSSVAVLGDLVLTGCYDNTVNIWNVTGAKVNTGLSLVNTDHVT